MFLCALLLCACGISAACSSSEGTKQTEAAPIALATSETTMLPSSEASPVAASQTETSLVNQSEDSLASAPSQTPSMESGGLELSDVLPSDDAPVVEIKENMFILQCDDIFVNPDDYVGKWIVIEGMYSGFGDTPDMRTHYVQRNSPGCCGNDGVIGFQFYWDGNEPKENDWIRVKANVRIIKREDGYRIVSLSAHTVDVLQERGAEYVST